MKAHLHRRAIVAALATAAVSFAAPAIAQDKSIVVSSTTSTQDSGLFGHILPLFKARTGIDVKVISQGTGQALDTGRRGDADVVFVHAKPQEETFVADGAGVKRFPVMYNDFILVGPKSDPERFVRGLGETFEIVNTNIKRWTVGSPIQAPLDSLSYLIKNNKFSAADVEKVVVRVSHQGARTTDNRSMPDINMQYMVSVMLLDGTATLEVQTGIVPPGSRVVLVDDVLATGGTAAAAVALMDGVNADVLGLMSLLEINELGGRDRLSPLSVWTIHQI